MTKPYTFEEIRKFLEEELKKAKHIMTFGVFGSLNLKNDMDILITKEPRSKTSNFYREIHNLFNNIDSYLNKKCRGRLIRVSRANHEEEVKYIAKYDPERDLVIQATTYVSLPQIKRAWAFDFGSWKELDAELPNILKKQHFFIGSSDMIFSEDFSKEVKSENVYGALDLMDRINSHYPRDFLILKMNLLYNYLARKRLKVKSLKAKNEREVREIFYKICDLAEKKN